jgi:hypothetical protein
VTWTRDRARGIACKLVAEDKFTDRVIAQQAGISKATLERWKHLPEFHARVLEHCARYRRLVAEATLQHALARHDERMRCLHEEWERILQLLDERARDPAVANAPGGRTGLVLRRLKTLRVSKWIKVGRQRKLVLVPHVVAEYYSDQRPVIRLLQLAKQVAKEMKKLDSL